jgi:hypothetical protein
MADLARICKEQRNRSDFKEAIIGSISFDLVSHAVLAVYSVFWLRKWQKNNAEMKRMWPNLTWFCALTLVSCISGFVAGSFSLQYRLLVIDAFPHLKSFAYSRIFESVSFLCHTVAKLMLLHQLMYDAPRASGDSFARSRRSPLLLRISTAITVISCGTHFVASCVTAHYAFRAASDADPKNDEVYRTSYIVALYCVSIAAVLLAAACAFVVTHSIVSSLRLEGKGQRALLVAGKFSLCCVSSAVMRGQSHSSAAPRSSCPSPRYTRQRQSQSHRDGVCSGLDRGL